MHSRIFDEMGFLPATPYNKINIHVGGTYGDKEAALERFSKVCMAQRVIRYIHVVRDLHHSMATPAFVLWHAEVTASPVVCAAGGE